jgi:hypothetical protein
VDGPFVHARSEVSLNGGVKQGEIGGCVDAEELTDLRQVQVRYYGVGLPIAVVAFTKLYLYVSTARGSKLSLSR